MVSFWLQADIENGSRFRLLFTPKRTCMLFVWQGMTKSRCRSLMELERY